MPPSQMSSSKSIGKQMLDMLDLIIELMEHTKDPDRKKELNQLRKKLSKQARTLIDANLKKSSQEYKAAASGLKSACGEIREAIKGLESIKKAITGAAKALDLVAKVIP